MEKLIKDRLMLGIVLLLFSGIVSAKNITEVYESNYVSANKLLLAIEPVMPSEIKTSVYDNKIILNGSENDINSVVSILKTLDVPQELWQVNVYVGDKPDISGAESFSTNISGRSNRYMSVKALNGTQAEISLSATVKDISNVSGYNTNSGYIENQDDTNAENRSVLVGEIQEIDNDIAMQQKTIDDYKNDNPGATVNNDGLLSGYVDDLDTLKNNRAVKQAKLVSYQESLDSIKTQSSYNSYGGNLNYNYISLPDALYVTPTKSGDLVKVKVVSVNSSIGNNSNYDSRRINTEVITEPGKWSQIYGNNIDEDGTIYSTEVKTTSSNIWVKVEKIK